MLNLPSYTRIVCLCAALLTFPLADAAEPVPSLIGTWVVNEDLSDDVRDAFDDKLRAARRGSAGSSFTPGRGSGGPRSGPEVAQDNYWETVQKNRERRSMRDLARLGTAYPLLTIEQLKISATGDDFLFVYDDLLPRQVRPNPAGRSYSANGDELVIDSLGFTLAYWDKAALVLETDQPNGGKIIERMKLTTQPLRIEHSIRLKMLVLKEPVTVTRIFERKAPGQD